MSIYPTTPLAFDEHIIDWRDAYLMVTLWAYPGDIDVPTNQTGEFKIKLPINVQDGREGQKCVISGAWAPAHYLRPSILGPKAACFADTPYLPPDVHEDAEEMLGE